MGEILDARTALAVKVVEAQEKMDPGTIYVVPSGCDIEIADGSVEVKRDEQSKRIKPSVDRLFQTAARAYGERLIAVILSGMGTDGVAGAREVKERGGTVIVQEPASAEYPSMPLSLPPTVVDFTRKVEEIGPLIEALVARTDIVEEEDREQALRAFLAHVRDRSGIDFLQYKTPTIRRRLARLMAAAGATTYEEYQRYLQQNPEAYQRLVSSFLIKVTGFFRDTQLYKVLGEQTIPQLVEAARSGERTLRLWSAGCATGEEAYSLAILVAELLRTETEAFDVRIFATDLDEEAVAFARRGVYSRDAFEGVSEALIQRYFTPLGDAYEVGKFIRNMTVFGQHDLGQRAPFPRIDLVLCRNVLIYFTKELQQHALQLFAFSLRNGGYLVLGKAETTNPAQEFFKPRNTALKIFQRQGERVLIPPSRLRGTYQPIAPQSPRKHAPHPAVPVPRGGEVRPASLEFVGNLIFNSPLGIVVIDRRYDIVSINRSARMLLSVHGVGVGEDIIHTATAVERNALRELIDTVLRGEDGEVTREITVSDGTGDGDRYLRVSAYPDTLSGGGTRAQAVVLMLIDVTSMAASRRELEQQAAQHSGELSTTRARSEELAQRQRQLLEANDELTSGNLELRNSNEQLLISLEESASSTEEIETLNEEMQATNEELETLNEELQATVEELNTTNDELEARGRSLESVSKARETALLRSEQERDTFRAALDEVEEPVVLISEDGVVLFSNAAAEPHLQGLRLDAQGRLLSLSELPKAKLKSGTLKATSRPEGGDTVGFEASIRAVTTRGITRWLVTLRNGKAIGPVARLP